MWINMGLVRQRTKQLEQKFEWNLHNKLHMLVSRLAG